MTGGGLFALVAYGAQNVLLSSNPAYTNFYRVYKKYAHFSEESVTFSMDGPQNLSYDQPIQVRFKFQRVADLVRDIYFTFTLPDIYCKYIETLPTASGRQSQYNFAWTNYIGCHIIQNVGFFIGGQMKTLLPIHTLSTLTLNNANSFPDSLYYQRQWRLIQPP